MYSGIEDPAQQKRSRPGNHVEMDQRDRDRDRQTETERDRERERQRERDQRNLAYSAYNNKTVDFSMSRVYCISLMFPLNHLPN